MTAMPPAEMWMKLRRGVLLCLAMALASCNQAILTAPAGSTLSLFANPPFIPANGGVSQISALLIEPAGTPVADGTVVQFFTTLGSIAEQGKTNDGVVRVNLISDTRSGIATVTAVSGGGSGSSGIASPTPTSSTGTGTAPGAAVLSVEAPVQRFAVTGAAATLASGTVEVRIGTILPARVVVTADPSRITISRSTHVFANVLDERGNPVPNISVIFHVVKDPATEVMDSNGNPIFTDSSGRAEDVMRTKRERGSVGIATVEVILLSSGSIKGTVDIPIDLE